MMSIVKDFLKEQIEDEIADMADEKVKDITFEDIHVFVRLQQEFIRLEADQRICSQISEEEEGSNQWLNAYMNHSRCLQFLYMSLQMTAQNCRILEVQTNDYSHDFGNTYDTRDLFFPIPRTVDNMIELLTTAPRIKMLAPNDPDRRQQLARLRVKWYPEHFSLRNMFRVLMIALYWQGKTHENGCKPGGALRKRDLEEFEYDQPEARRQRMLEEEDQS
jgi:hypothetical protein